MDNSIFMRSYLRPLVNMMKEISNPERIKDLKTRMDEFILQNKDLTNADFKKKIKEEFEFDVEIARFNCYENMLDVIMKKVLFFFWLSIISIVISVIAAIGFLGP